jgi:CO/xanthine dehydrogenase Mo-binding subunit
MDELAHAVGMDPLAFRHKNLTEPRLLAVLNAAADKFGWAPAKSTPTRGFGIACGMEKGGHVATCAEVAIDPATKKVRIVRVVQAWESGAVVNPDGLRNQNMGAIVQGIGGALFEAIQFGDGRILNPHFESYRLPRFSTRRRSRSSSSTARTSPPPAPAKPAWSASPPRSATPSSPPPEPACATCP